MKNIKLTLRGITRNKKTSFIKILSLSIGFAIALILFAKVNFDQSFNSFYPDAVRIYRLATKHKTIESTNPFEQYNQVPGGVAVRLKDEIPEIESATRYTYIARNETFFDKDQNKYKGTFILADSCLFDVLPLPIITGDPKEILSQPMMIMVSQSIAQSMGGEVIGKQIIINSYPNNVLTIGGVFEDMPKNSNSRYDIIISMPSVSQFIWDGTEYMLGNQRYLGYIKLVKGVDPSSLEDAFYQMQVKYQDIEQMQKEYGGIIRYGCLKLSDYYKSETTVKRSIMIMNILAISILLATLLNYILFTISSVMERGRNIGVYKTYGASTNTIIRMMIVETLVYFIISILLAILWIYLGKGLVQNIFDLPVSILFTVHSILILLGLMLVIFLLTTIVPSYMLVNIPVTAAFRSLKENRKIWKKCLLFLLFSASSFLLSLLLIVSLQYRKLLSEDVGFDYQKLLFVNLEDKRVDTAIEKIKQLSFVENAGQGSTLPGFGASGNGVSLPENSIEIFNLADFYYVDEQFVPTMGIKIIEGSAFTAQNTKSDIIVSQNFATQIANHTGWKDGVINKQVNISEHGVSNIVGVYEDVPVGSLTEINQQPSAFFYNPEQTSVTVIRLSEINGEHILAIQRIFDEIIPDREAQVLPYFTTFVKQYDKEDKFKQSIMIIGIVTLLINMIGLIGYLQNEIIRRSAEIAIRKINGATLSNILALFVKDILYLSLPAFLVGSFVAYYVGQLWMEDFAVKIFMNPLIFITCALFLIVIVLLIIVLSCVKISNQNPVESLKQE